MDLLAHACYGATVCSRSGLAGGRTGAGRRWVTDATVWWSVLFGLLPDIISMWTPFALYLASGVKDNFFHYLRGSWLEVYRCVHSLLPALLVAGVIWLFRRRPFVPAFAWAIHILCDAISHSSGKFQTMPFYPLSTWHIEGIPFWRTPWFVIAYWSVLVLTWIVLIILRHKPQPG